MHKGIAFAVAVLALALPSSAGATFHLMKVSEVSNVNGSQFVELQMYSGGQNLVGGHHLQSYDAGGTVIDEFQFPADVGQGGNQRTILAAYDPGTLPGGTTADFPGTGLPVPNNGTVCFMDTIAPALPIDCVTYGTVTATPFPTGTPAQTLPFDPGSNTLQRTIAPNCPTALDAADDTGDSATDFSLAAPTPRNNATAPTEVPCPGQPGGGGGGDTNDPQTTITTEPKNRSVKRKAKWAFTSDEPGSTFECKLDGKGFKPCDSPYVKRVKVGRHKFEVAAIDPAGNRDETPDRDRFKRRPR